MPCRVDGPSAAAAAMTEENPARTSGMVTSAPWSFDTPRTTAECTADESWKRQAGPPRQVSNSSISPPMALTAST